MAKPIAVLTLVAGLCTAIGSRTRAAELVLAEDGRSAYRIVVADDASPSTRHGAEELQTFLQQITGAKLPVTSDKRPMEDREIILGNNAHLKSLGLKIDFQALDFQALGDEGYVIRTAGKHLVIAGGKQRGNMYGVYGLLEDHLGCRWFAPGVSRIPKHRRLALGRIDDRQVPVLEYREPFTFDCFDGDWCARNRVNSSSGRLTAAHGGKVRFGGGFFVHTFNRLVPPEKFFDQHPEYFSLVKGKRLKDRSQLCCTNEDVIRHLHRGDYPRRHAGHNPTLSSFFRLAERLAQLLRPARSAEALAEKEEDSQIAPVLQLVNRVAEVRWPRRSFPTRRSRRWPINGLVAHRRRMRPRRQRDRAALLDRVLLLASAWPTCDSPSPTGQVPRRRRRPGPRSATGYGSGTT